MTARRILLDAGNSSVKWAAVEDGRWDAQGRCDYDDLAALAPQLTTASMCYVASVANSAREHAIATLLDEAGTAATWLKAEASFGGVRNHYRDPGQLGVDRWMGLVAARSRTTQAALVVSVGTAMTVDALSASGDFLGGIIVPGMALMRQSLDRGTARVAVGDGGWRPFPLCTADAVESGIVAALCGAIEQQYARLVTLAAATPACLVTGGDAAPILPRLEVAAEYVAALVLEGIDRVATGGDAR